MHHNSYCMDNSFSSDFRMFTHTRAHTHTHTHTRLISYLWLALSCRAVVKLNVAVPAVAVNSNSIPVSLNNGVPRANNARTEAAIKATITASRIKRHLFSAVDTN